MAKGTTPGTPGNANKTSKTQPPRVAPVLTAISKTVPMPDRNANRGSKTSYPFEALTETGMSFGVKNKTSKQLASIISNQNRKPGPAKRNADGSIVYETQDMTAPDGTVTKIPTTKAETLPGKQFFAVDCDPKTDPDGASVRVFRQS